MKTVNILEKLAQAQVSHPWRFLIPAVLVTIVAGVIAAGLKFDSSYEALLPKGAPEVENADDIRARTGGTRQLVVAIGGEDADARLKFGRRLIKKIEKLEGVRRADLEFPVDFFKDRGLWLSDLATLDNLIPALKDAVSVAQIQANPLALHLDEEEEKKELDAAWKKVDDIIASKRNDLPFEGVLTSSDNKYTFLLVTPSIKFSDMEAGRLLLERMDNVVSELSPKSAGVDIKYAGNLKVIQEQHLTMSKDLRLASIIALVFGVLIVTGFTRRLQAPFLIGSALLAGIAWTFAAARLLVGHVNIITGFLAAVLIGLGIDFGIHLFVRYQQEASRSGATITLAVKKIVTGTAAPALTSALTTACVFFSFTIADFRGFSEFGLIAGIGVIFTMLSSFIILPPLIYLRYRGDKFAKTTVTISDSKASAPFSKGVAATAVVLLGACAIYGVVNVGKIPFRNNFRQLRGHSEATEFFEYVDNNLGAGFNPAVFLSATPAYAAHIADAAMALKGTTRPDGTPSKIGKVLSINDFLPAQVDEHQTRVSKLFDILWDPKLDKAAEKGGAQAEKLVRARKMVKTTPWQIEDLPEVVRERFMTLDKREYITFVWPFERNDADYQAEAWERELNDLSVGLSKDGINHDMADETLIVAWIYKLIKADGLPLLAASIVVVFLLLLIDFRSFKDASLVGFPLFVGMMSFLGIMHLWGLEINMFNMVVIPSVIGIGIDNAVHIFHRYKHEGRGSIRLVIRTTGRAAFLASFTTAVGFGSSMISHNLGLRSMGFLAVIGIIATFLSATVFFPGMITLLEGRKKTC